MALTPEDELELLELERERILLMKQKQGAAAPATPAPQPSVEDLYAQEQEAIENTPYVSPEMNAQIDASLEAARRHPPSSPTRPPPSAPVQPQQQSGIMDSLTQLGSIANPVAGVGIALADVATPYLKGVADFSQREVGAPVVDALYKHDVMSPVFEGTAIEPLRRQMLATIAGEDWANRTSSSGGEHALKEAVSGIPGVGGEGTFSPSVDTATGFIKGAAQSVPSIAMAGVSRSVGAVSKLGPLTSRLIGVAAEGAVGGALEGLLIKSQDPKTSAVMGAVVGPLLDLGAQGAAKIGGKAFQGAKKLLGKAAPEAVPVGVITKEARHQLADELAAIPAEPRTAPLPEGSLDNTVITGPRDPIALGKAQNAVPTTPKPDELTPFNLVARIAEDGTPSVAVVELKRGAEPRIAEMPVGTAAERAKVFSYMQKNNIEFVDLPREVMANPKFTTFMDELWQHQSRVMHERGFDPNIGYATHPANKPTVSSWEPEAGTPPTRASRTPRAKPDAGLSPPDSDAPPGPRDFSSTSVIRETPEGHLTLRDEVGTDPLLTDSNTTSIRRGGRGERTPYLSNTGIQGSKSDAGALAAAEPPPPPRPPGGMGPPPPPPAPPPPGPGSIPPIQLEQMQTIIGAMDKMSRQPGLWEKTMRQLVGAHARGPKDAGELILMQRASKVLGETTKDVYNRLRELVPKKQRFGFDKDFARYAAGDKLAADALRTKYPKVWGQVEELGNKLLQERDAIDGELRRLGFLPDELAPLIENGTFDKYLARSYLSYVLPPGEWAKYVRKNRMDLVADAAAFFKDKFPKWSESDIAAELVRILRAEDPLDAFQGSALNSKGKAANSLKARGSLPSEVRVLLRSGKPADLEKVLARKDVSAEVKALIRSGKHHEALGLALTQADIPAPIRALMGEVESGTYKLAVSLGNQRALLANARMWNEIVANPTMFSPTARPDLHPVPLPDSPRHFGPASGGYVTPHLYEALVNLPKAIESGPQWLRSIIGFTKGNEVALGGAGPWFNAIMGNTFVYSELAGGISPVNPGHMGKYLYRAMKALRDYAKNPTGDNWVMSAKRYGTDASGVGGLEFDPSSNVAEELFGDMLREGGAKSAQDTIAGWGKRIAHDLKKGYGAVGRKYDLVDRTYKLANFMAIVDREVARGMDIHAAMKHASYRVNQSFPAPDKQGPIPQRISRGMPGLFAKYGTFYMENLRVMGMLPKRMLEEPDLRWRMLKSAMLMGGLWGYNSLNRYMSGITQDEIDKLEARQSDGQKYYKPLTFVAGWRNAKGEPQVWDLTQLVPLGNLLGGHPDDAPFRRILGNLVTSGFDSGVAENEVQGFMARTGLVRPIRQPSDMMPGEDRTLQALQMAWDFGLAPKAPERVYEALRKTEAFGPVGPATDTYTPGEAAAKIAGFPVVPSPGQGALNATTFEFMAAEKEFQRQLRSVANKPPAQALGFLQQMYRAVAYDSKDAHKEAKLQAIQEAFIKETKRMEERQRILGGKK